MNPRHKYQTFFQFLALAIFYIVGMNLFMFLKLLGISELQFTTEVQRHAMLPASTIIGLVIALSLGLLELKLFSKWNHFSFRKFLVYKYAIIIFTIVAGNVIIFFTLLVFAGGVSVNEALRSIPALLHSQMFLSVFIYLLLFSIFINMFKTVSEHLGPEALLGALFGQNHQPLEEDRTFIFIDLQSSTNIAEKLGHVQYSLFIDRCFQILTNSIYKFNASLYQFVGDEAVLTWKTASAKETLSPVFLYHAFVNHLQMEEQIFLDKFGEVPHFKAAIHTGWVSVTKIRSTKMDIVYHGDVLNTCARMVGECNRLKKDLLVSSTVAEWIENRNDYSVAFADSLLLRGKGTATELFEVIKK